MWVWLGTHERAKSNSWYYIRNVPRLKWGMMLIFCLSIRGYLRKLIWVAVANIYVPFAELGVCIFQAEDYQKKPVKTRKRWHVGSTLIFNRLIFFFYILGVKIPFTQNRYIVFQIKLKYPLLVDIYRNSKLIPSFQAVYQPSS